MTREQDDRITGIVGREQSRLWNFIRRRVPDARDAEDILQEVFAELVEANRLLMPIDHATGWLFRVARNRITDLFRRRRPERFSDLVVPDDERLSGDRLSDDRLPESVIRAAFDPLRFVFVLGAPPPGAFMRPSPP